MTEGKTSRDTERQTERKKESKNGKTLWKKAVKIELN